MTSRKYCFIIHSLLHKVRFQAAEAAMKFLHKEIPSHKVTDAIYSVASLP